jgi:hypothetical protein
MANEKRKLTRRHLIYYLPVLDCETGSEIGRLVDITPEGIMIDRQTSYPSGQTLTLRMILPEAVQDETEIEFTAESVWCRKDKNPDLFGVGFKMVKISDQTISIIEDIITRLSFNQ